MLRTSRPINGTPDRLIVLLSASRSGSTTVHDLLSRCPGVAALAGEIEPYLRLTGNAQGADGSNQIIHPRDVAALRELVRTDLREWAHPCEPTKEYSHRRTILQWPESGYCKDAGWIDGSKSTSVDLPILEEPPLVPIAGARRPESLDGKVVLIKTPQLVYRRPVIECLFPGVPIQYVWLQRSAPGTVNGLLDGWLGPHFWSYRLPAPDGSPLPGWWCFDVPPGWHKAKTLLDACVKQWYEANRSAIWFKTKLPKHVLKYETIAHGGATQLAFDLGLAADGLTTRLLMASAPPSVNRWVRCRPVLADLLRREPVKNMMSNMGYTEKGMGEVW